MDYKETLNAMTLARLSYYSQASILLLYRKAGSATAVIDNIDNIRDILPDASQRLAQRQTPVHCKQQDRPCPGDPDSTLSHIPHLC